MGAAKIDVIWYRQPLQGKLDGDAIAATLEAAGFRVRRQGGHLDARIDSTDLADTFRGIEVDDVHETTPVIDNAPNTEPVQHLSEDLALSIQRVTSRTRAARAEASNAAGEVLSVEDTPDGFRLVTLHAEAVTWLEESAPGSADTNLTTVINTAIKTHEDEVVPGLGRCISAKAVAPRESLSDYDLLKGRRAVAVQLVYKSRVANSGVKVP